MQAGQNADGTRSTEGPGGPDLAGGPSPSPPEWGALSGGASSFTWSVGPNLLSGFEYESLLPLPAVTTINLPDGAASLAGPGELPSRGKRRPPQSMVLPREPGDLVAALVKRLGQEGAAEVSRRLVEMLG